VNYLYGVADLGGSCWVVTGGEMVTSEPNISGETGSFVQERCRSLVRWKGASREMRPKNYIEM
jgi:hypothetical protein